MLFRSCREKVRPKHWQIFYNKPYDGPVLRVAILGLGSYGTRVADAMQSCKAAKLVGAISGTPSKLPAWQSKYGIPGEELL